MKYRNSLFILVLFAFASCRNKDRINNNMPISPVFYKLYLNSKDARPLLSPSGIIKIQRINSIGEILPPKGIVIARSIDINNEYYAFDLMCPYDYPNQIELNISGIDLVCPRCKSHFQIIYGRGNPIKGPSNYNLIKYKVYKSDLYLMIKSY